MKPEDLENIASENAADDADAAAAADADGLTPMLRSHLARRLDPHLGRAAAAFEREPTRAVASPRLRRLIPLAIGSAIAASLLVAWAITRTGGRGHGSTPGDPLVIGKSDPPVVNVAGNDLAPGDVERLVTWKAYDEGSRIVNASPARQVRLESVEEIRWADPELDATFRLSVPTRQVILVKQQTF